MNSYSEISSYNPYSGISDFSQISSGYDYAPIYGAESETDAPFYESILPESNTMLYGGIAAIIILGVCFWFFVGRKKGKFHAQGKEMMNKAKDKVVKASSGNRRGYSDLEKGNKQADQAVEDETDYSYEEDQVMEKLRIKSPNPPPRPVKRDY